MAKSILVFQEKDLAFDWCFSDDFLSLAQLPEEDLKT
jgi:hypothetical protein